MSRFRPLALRPPSARVLLAGGLGAALAVSSLVTVDASSHREAPLIADDPSADNTDVYAFVAPDATDSVTLIANWYGFQEPGGGPNYFSFGDDVLHEIHIDNDGDAVADVTYEFRFTTQIQNPDTYLYATGPITDIEGPEWTAPQEYSVTKVENGVRTVVNEGLRTAPSNVGPRTTPNYEALVEQAKHTLPGGGKVFAGQRAEGFFIDIASIFDLGGLRPLNDQHAIPLPVEPGKDTFAGYNVQSIALQVPKTEVTDGDPVIGVWSTSSRRKVRVFAQNSGANPMQRGRWVQVSRLGNPLVNEVVVPIKAKDAFNSLKPVQDADVFPTLSAPGQGSTEGPIPLVTDPILANQIEALYGVDTPPTPRNDLVAIYLTGIEGVNQPQGEVRPAEMLRLNTSIAPTPFASQNRLGFLAGQNDGFPNGRRVIDDITDISLRAVAGGTPLTPAFNVAPNNALSDGVDASDSFNRGSLQMFPYLATPYQGYELNNQPRDGD
jgi:hypothetical protein